MDDETKDQLLTQLIENPTTRTRTMRNATLTTAEQEETTSLLNIADLLWEHEQKAPPYTEDPVAKMLQQETL